MDGLSWRAGLPCSLPWLLETWVEVSQQRPGCDPQAPPGPRRLQPCLDTRSRTGVLSSMRACLLAVHSRDPAGLGSDGTVKPCFLEYKICSFPFSTGPPVGGTSFPRSPAPWLLPVPPTPTPLPMPSKHSWCQEVTCRGSAPPRLHQSKPHTKNSHCKK